MLSAYSLTNQLWKKRLYWQLIERSSVKQAALFHATSEAERDEVLRIRSDADVQIIPNGVDETAWLEEVRPDTLANRLRISRGDRQIVLFLSRLHPKKGIIDLLLPAWAQLETKSVLAIAGGPDSHAPGYETQVHREVERLGLGCKVRMLGEIRPAERWSLFDGADLFVLPSHSENFGIVVAEAMARGCPVLVTDQVQIHRHVTAANAGTVIPRSIDSLAAGLRSILADDERRKTSGALGRQYARVHFSWQRIAARVVRMYEDTLSDRRRTCSFFCNSPSAN
jgi:glycosyltransferase involved in cell wall biosynthesis